MQTKNDVILVADVVILRVNGRNLELLTIKTDKAVFEGKLALPGGKEDRSIDENIKSTAVREVWEETGLIIDPDYLELIGVFDKEGRDPRGDFVSHAFRYIPMFSYTDSLAAYPGSDSKAIVWIRMDQVDNEEFAFDHGEIIDQALACWPK